MPARRVKKALSLAARALSIGAGALIGVAGLSRRSAGGLLLAVAGATVVHRAITGRWLPFRHHKAADEASSPPLREAPYPDDLDVVDEAGMESFPASDPPAYTRR